MPNWLGVAPSSEECRQYLKTHNWTWRCTLGGGYFETWESAAAYEIELPVREVAGDYHRRMCEFLEDLARVESRPVEDILREIRSPKRPLGPLQTRQKAHALALMLVDADSHPRNLNQAEQRLLARAYLDLEEALSE